MASSHISCSPSPTERVVRGVVALILASVALTTMPTDPVVGVFATLSSGAVAFMAIIGWCPASLMRPESERDGSPTESLSLTDAREIADIATRIRMKEQQP
ncbi:DUF2892 domain-containing protein [Microbacterium esteraromaticum]|jgi:hypothetical protein|nr:DUF2892 domain-containing protein [Microbacterium esteraromaticum]